MIVIPASLATADSHGILATALGNAYAVASERAITAWPREMAVSGATTRERPDDG